MISISSWLL